MPFDFFKGHLKASGTVELTCQQPAILFDPVLDCQSRVG